MFIPTTFFGNIKRCAIWKFTGGAPSGGRGSYLEWATSTIVTTDYMNEGEEESVFLNPNYTPTIIDGNGTWEVEQDPC